MREKSLLAALIIGMVLTACKGGSEGTPAAGPALPSSGPGDEPATILFAADDYEQSYYEDLIQTFEKANPGLRVELVSFQEALGLGSGDAWPEPQIAWQRLASAADVINIPASDEAVQQGLVRDLTPLIEADPTFQPEDFYPDTLESMQWDGGAWSLPTAVTFQFIFFDKTAFDQAGVAYPEPGWTWDDFVAKARALTLREGDDVARWGFVQPWPFHLPFIEGRVGRLVDLSTDPPTPLFDRPEAVQAVRWYTDLYLEEGVTPFLTDGRTLIEGGRAAMWRDLASSWQSGVGVAPFPVDDPRSHTTLTWVRGVSMSAGTVYPKAAWHWIDFLSRQGGPGQESPAPWLPARRSAAEAIGFWEAVDEELAETLRYAIEHSYTLGEGPGYEAFLEAIEAILKEEKSVEAALAEAQVQAQAKIQKGIAGQAQATPVPTPHVAASTNEQTNRQTERQTITFIPAAGGLDLKPYRIVARQFQEAHPDIVVQVEIPPDYSSNSNYVQTLAKAADCFRLYPPDLQNPQNREYILSLDPFLEADPSVAADDFYAPALEQFTWEGQPWGLPTEIDVRVIEYNKGLFDAAGVDYPALEWTIDDFVTIATALTRGEGASKQYGFVSEVFEWSDMELMVDLLGARLVDQSVDPSALSFDDPTTIAAMRTYVSLSTQGVKPVFITHAPAAASESIIKEREALIEEGRAAMWTRVSQLDVTERSAQPSTGVVLVPARADGASVPTGIAANGYFIRRGADAGVRQACWEWIVFLTGRPELIQGFPARRSTAESEAYRQQVGAERATAYLASLASVTGIDGPSIYVEEPWLSPARYWLIQAYDQAVQGEATVEEALDEAQRMADEYRACIIVRDAFDDREEWDACVSEVDPANTLFSDPTEQE